MLSFTQDPNIHNSQILSKTSLSHRQYLAVPLDNGYLLNCSFFQTCTLAIDSYCNMPLHFFNWPKNKFPRLTYPSGTYFFIRVSPSSINKRNEYLRSLLISYASLIHPSLYRLNRGLIPHFQIRN